TRVHELRGHTQEVHGLACTPRGVPGLIASGGWDRTVKVWDEKTGAEVSSLQWEGLPARTLAFHPDGRRLACSQTGGVRVGAVTKGGKGVYSQSSHGQPLLDLAFSPDGRRLAGGGLEKVVCVWDTETGAMLRCLRGHRRTILHVAFGDDGRSLVSGG